MSMLQCIVNDKVINLFVTQTNFYTTQKNLNWQSTNSSKMTNFSRLILLYLWKF